MSSCADPNCSEIETESEIVPALRQTSGENGREIGFQVRGSSGSSRKVGSEYSVALSSTKEQVKERVTREGVGGNP